MRILIGSDLGDYVFDPSTKTIKILDVRYNLKLKNILSIFNTNDGQMIYSFTKSGYGGTISDNVLVLDYDTTPMSASDELQIWVDVPDGIFVTDVADSLRRLCFIMGNLSATVDKSTNRTRNTTVLESGTVTTVTEVTAMNALGNYSSNTTVGIIGINAWNNGPGRRFT